MEKIEVTPDQALQAFKIMYAIINEAFPNGARYTATQINLDPSYAKQMYDLLQEARENDLFTKRNMDATKLR